MRGLAAVLAAGTALLALACGGAAADQRRTPRPAPSSTAAEQADPAAWLQKGATVVPPASVRNVSRGSIEVVDQTAGALSDQDAQRWALAYLRANAYELWAWNNLQDAFLLRGGLSQVPAQVFGYDLTSIQQARAAGARIEVTRLTLRRLVLRPVPESLRQQFTGHLFVWTQYAFYLDQVGPSKVDWIDAQGNRTTKARQEAGIGSPELVGGVLTSDPLMGEIWVSNSDWDCTSPTVRQPFGPLCAA